jgi:glycosyltransferase involved in cell wall biosynthesis
LKLSKDNEHLRIGIVHDYLNQYGGAERVVEALHELFPDAPIFTSFYLPDNLPPSFRKMDIRQSFISCFPFLNRHFKKYLLFYPLAFQSFDLTGYDLILSSSSAFAKGIKVPQGALHICYCYSPMRFVWDYENYIEKEEFGRVTKWILPWIIQYLKRWDLVTVSKVHHFISISNHIKERISKCYHVDSEVIYPPVKCDRFKIGDKQEGYYLIVSRLNAYKRIDLVIDTFNKLGLPLLIAGEGPRKKALEVISNKNITFLGRVSEEQLPELYSNSKAFIFPGMEDFGMAPVEAMASGRPVIAFGKGGALETVQDGKTGILFNEQSSNALSEAVTKLENTLFDPILIKKQAERFSENRFKKQLRQFIDRKYEEFHGDSKCPLSQ